MSAIRGTYLNGTIVPDTLPGCAEGTRVDLNPADAWEIPLSEDDSPEANAKRLAVMDTLRPVMSEEEALEWERQRAEDKARELADWGNWARKIGAIFP